MLNPVLYHVLSNFPPEVLVIWFGFNGLVVAAVFALQLRRKRRAGQ